MKKVTFGAFVALLLFLTVCNIGFCQDKFNAKKFEVEKKYDDKIKKRIKNYRAVELKVSDFKNLVKNKHKYQEGVNLVLNIDGENVEFRLFENDIIDDNFTLFINGKPSKPKKNGVETFDFWTTFYALKNGNRIAYPNPSSDNVTIEDPDKPTETLAMKLFDERGVLIGEYQNENNIKSSGFGQWYLFSAHHSFRQHSGSKTHYC